MNLGFLKDFDCFSPKITLYFKGKQRHVSVFSGVLSLIQYFIFVSTTIYYLNFVFNHKNPTFFYVKKYVNNLGKFELNEVNFPHNITLQGKTIFDPRAISVIGVENLPSNILSEEEYLKDHWNYGLCEEGSKIETLCIKNFFNHTLNRTFKAYDEGFIFPSIIQETLDDNSTPYNIIIKPCKNSTFNNFSCYADFTIKEMITNLFSFELTFTDKFVDVDRYENPFVHHHNSFKIGLFDNSITASNAHFNPTIVKTNEGLLFNRISEKTTYTLDKIIHGSYQKEEMNILGIISLWIHNKVDVYERSYMGLPNILANITAINKLTWSILFIINYIVNQYVVHNDFFQYYQKSYFRIIKCQNFSPSTESSIKTQNFVSETIIKNGNKMKAEDSVVSLGKFPHFSMKKMFLHLYGCRKSTFIKNLMNFRMKALDEEKFIQYHMLFFNIENSCCLSKNLRFNKKFQFEKNISNMSNSNKELIQKVDFIRENLGNKKY